MLKVAAHARSPADLIPDSCCSPFPLPLPLLPPAQCLDLHSRLSQKKRDKAAADFAANDGVLLFASDVIARGLDFPDVTLVVQVGLTDATQYEHRGELCWFWGLGLLCLVGLLCVFLGARPLCLQLRWRCHCAFSSAPHAVPLLSPPRRPNDGAQSAARAALARRASRCCC